MADKVYTVKIDGLPQLDRLTGRLGHAKRQLLERSKDRLVDEIKKRAPRHVAAKVRGQVVGADEIEVGTFGSRDARALDRGATILPKGHPFLKFETDTGVHFARRTVIRRNRPGGRFFERALAHRTSIVDDVYSETFGTDLLRE